MKRRERLLLVVVLVLLVGVAGRFAVRWLLLDPMAAKREQVAQLREERNLKARHVEQLQAAEKTLEAWRRESLPPDARLAPSMYQAWLTEQGNRAGFHGLQVLLESNQAPSRGKDVVYYRYPFSIKGSTSLEGLVNFLHAFYRAPLLHQVQQVNVSPAAGRRAAGELDVYIKVEGLALVDAQDWVIVPEATDPATVTLESGVDGKVYRGRRERDSAQRQQLGRYPGHRLVQVTRTKLLPGSAADSAEQGGADDTSRLAHGDREAYAQIVERNIFAPFQAPAAQPEGPDEARFYRLSKVTAEVYPGREVPEAELYSPLEDDYVPLRVGEEFEAAGIRGRVVSIGVRDVTLEIDQQRKRLRLGRNLRQLEAVADAQGNEGAGPNAPAEKAPGADGAAGDGPAAQLPQ